MKILLKHGWEKIPNWECLFVHREKGLFLSVYVDDKKIGWKETNLDPMWKLLNKEVDLGQPTSFLDHVYLGCTQRQCQTSKDIVDNYRTMFESRISAVRTEKLPFPQFFVKSIPPNTENSMQYGYNENDNNNMSNETKCETNYSINNKWNDVNTHNYMQLTKYNKYTNDDVYTDACVVHIIR